jgi:hypothetical protein
MRNMRLIMICGALFALMIGCNTDGKDPDGPVKRGTCHQLGDADKNGFNISTKLVDAGGGKSTLQFLTVERAVPPVPRVLVSDMTKSTVEVVLCASNKFQVNTIEGVKHFKGTEKTFDVSNSVDFKISMDFTHGGGGFWIIGTADDRPGIAKTMVYADLKYNADERLRPTIRLTYVSTGPKKGTVTLSSKNTDIKLGNVECAKTGVKQDKGWGIYNKCCPAPCS